jgi:hypothetical protein
MAHLVHTLPAKTVKHASLLVLQAHHRLVRVLMHTLGRVKDTSITALIELIHLVLHVQVRVHAELRLGLHLEG